MLRGVRVAVRRTAGLTAGSPSLPAHVDYQATTPVDPRVLDAMLPFLAGGRFGNAHSRSHSYGWEAEEAVERARGLVGKSIGGEGKEIVFTSGATESNNLAIKGVVGYLKRQTGERPHIITLQTEHKCVLGACRALEELGEAEVTYLGVDEQGLVRMEELERSIKGNTALISVMAVNNEIGVVQPMKEIGKLARSRKILFHTDAAQAVGKIAIDVNEMNIDLLSISGHKVYGPKGIGALYVRRSGGKRVRLSPMIEGGGQERGLRSGTLPVSLVVGLGEACRLGHLERERDLAHVQRLSFRLVDRIMKELPKVTINGSSTHRYPGNMNMSFACVEGESLLMALAKDVSVSSGSACTSASLEPSYVLRAIGVNEELAHTSLRFGLGRFSTDADVARVLERLVHEVRRLRDLSPLWDMEMDGSAAKIQWS